MPDRTIQDEHGIHDQLQKLGMRYERWDEVKEFLDLTLARHPEMFPTIPGTRLSICKTNEFADCSFSGVPSLVIYFHFDDSHVYLTALDLNTTTSYGL